MIIEYIIHMKCHYEINFITDNIDWFFICLNFYRTSIRIDELKDFVIIHAQIFQHVFWGTCPCGIWQHV